MQMRLFLGDNLEWAAELKYHFGSLVSCRFNKIYWHPDEPDQARGVYWLETHGSKEDYFAFPKESLEYYRVGLIYSALKEWITADLPCSFVDWWLRDQYTRSRWEVKNDPGQLPAQPDRLAGHARRVEMEETYSRQMLLYNTAVEEEKKREALARLTKAVSCIGRFYILVLTSFEVPEQGGMELAPAV